MHGKVKYNSCNNIHHCILDYSELREKHYGMWAASVNTDHACRVRKRASLKQFCVDINMFGL